MENMLKVYIYQEGEKPIFHDPILEGIYASEGWFMKLLEANKNFITKDPTKAHLFYLPYGSQMLKLKVYVPNSHKRTNVIKYMKDYVDMIAAKYSFWNRTNGADHFLAACHDWVTLSIFTHFLIIKLTLCYIRVELPYLIACKSKVLKIPVFPDRLLLYCFSTHLLAGHTLFYMTRYYTLFEEGEILMKFLFFPGIAG